VTDFKSRAVGESRKMGCCSSKKEQGDSYVEDLQMPRPSVVSNASHSSLEEGDGGTRKYILTFGPLSDVVP
jgi:hypothetical protein